MVFHYNSWIDEEKDEEVMENVNTYLDYEYKQCNKSKDDDCNWCTMKSNEMDNIVPQQNKKKGDCGLFILLFAEIMSQN